MSQPAKPWCLYVLKCGDGSLYCGITNDLVKRIKQHNDGSGARYTRGRGPVSLVHTQPAESMSAALKAEAAFKALTRPAKDKLLAAYAELETASKTKATVSSRKRKKSGSPKPPPSA